MEGAGPGRGFSPEAAEEKSRELGVKMNIAVVDSGANLVGFLRSD